MNAIAIGIILAFLTAGGITALIVGLRARAGAVDAAAQARTLRGLLVQSPAQLMIVRADGLIELSPTVLRWFGLRAAPRTLAELAGSGWMLSSADAEGLVADIEAARHGARPFERTLPIGTDNELALLVQGERDGLDVICWITDASEREAMLRRATAERQELSEAFGALAMLVEAAPMPIWYRDADLRIAMVNAAYVDAVDGADAATVVRQQVELVEGAGTAGPRASAAAAVAASSPSERVVPATIEGARRAQRVIDVPMPSGGVAGYAIDIEDLEQAGAREKRFAEAQRLTLDRLSAGVAQFGRDRALVFCNQPFRRMFAMRREWLTDRPEFDRILERMREAGRVPEVRDFPGWKAERRAWFTGAEGAVEEHWHLPAGTHLRVLAQPLPEGGLLLIFEDRTEQVQLASARDTLLRVRTATFDNLFEALGVFAADGRLQLWNNRFRAIWGLEEEFLAAHPRVDAIVEQITPLLAHPRRARFVDEIVRDATSNRRQRAGRIALADGRYFEFAAVPLPDGNALFTLLDVSDSRRMEQALRDRNDALEAADRVKTAFVANMSYELRTPLTSISGFAEMLQGGYAGKLEADAAGYVDAILVSVERLGTLVDDVLDLTQSDGDGAAEHVLMEMGAVAGAAAEALRGTADRHGIDLATELLPTAGRLLGDARRVREAIEHLLRHAMGSAGDGGRVLLRVDGDAQAARIVVSDDGPGLTPEAAERAFDRFAQSGITPGQERALSLGLPLAKQFVEAHGGRIALVSEQDAGTVVTAWLPREAGR